MTPTQSESISSSSLGSGIHVGNILMVGQFPTTI